MKLRAGLVRNFLVCAAALTAATASAADTSVDAEMVARLRLDLARSFALEKGMALDPGLRASAEEISKDHLERIGKLLPAWLEEERKQHADGKPPTPSQLFYAAWARVLNELALWHIDSGDADYERNTLAVLTSSPQVCTLEMDARFTDFASRIARIQAMPAAQRAAALATERQLLARWGLPRKDVAPWPDPLPQVAALAAIKALPAEKERKTLGLPPVLAYRAFAPGATYASMDGESQCALQRWWLRESLRQGAKAADVLNAFRYGTMISATDRMAGMFEQPDKEPRREGKPAYPRLASQFDVTGATVMRVTFAADGKPAQANVESRQIVVRGIRGVRPVAFENTFDKLAVSYAMDGYPYGKRETDAPARFRLAWTLNENGAAK